MHRIITTIITFALLTIAVAQTEFTSRAFATVLANDIDAAIVACDLPWPAQGFTATCIDVWGDERLVTMMIANSLNTFSDVSPVNAWEVLDTGSWARAYAVDDDDPMFMHGFNLIVAPSSNDPDVMQVNVVELGVYRTDTGDRVD
jgi:hypothetical protein